MLPYIQGTSEELRRILVRANIKAVFKPCTTLKQQLVKPEDPVCIKNRTGVVYSIPCKACPAMYIGQTGRPLETRVKEHKTAVRNGEVSSSALAEHAWNESHQIDWDDVSVLAAENNLQRRLTLESWHIHQHSTTVNRELGGLPSEYTPLLS